MKNVVMIHLESLNMSLLNGNREIFPNIWNAINNGKFYNNYWSNATSTIMAISDVMFGSIKNTEMSESLEHFRIQNLEKSIPFELKKRGMDCQCIMYPKYEWVYDSINTEKIFGKKVNVSQFSSLQDFNNAIKQAINEMDGQLLYVFNWSSVCFNNQNGVRESNWKEFYKRIYGRIDDTVGGVINELIHSNKMKDTLLILFGDHGDEFYTYGEKNGFSHAIEPYPRLLHTPLVICEADKGNGVDDKLVCSEDLMKIIYSYLGYKCEETNRAYVFARNLFPMQKSKNLNKAFAVTDGQYLLMVSRKGLEMYCCMFENQSVYNLLNCFCLHKNNKIELINCKSNHYRRNIGDQKNTIISEYSKLFVFLKKEIKRMGRKGYLGNNTDIDYWTKKIHYTNCSVGKRICRQLLKKWR